MQIQPTEVMISTPDGQMPAFLYTPTEPNRKPAVLLLMEAFGHCLIENDLSEARNLLMFEIVDEQSHARAQHL